MSRSLTPRTYRKTFFEGTDEKTRDNGPRNRSQAANNGDDEPFHRERHCYKRRQHPDRCRRHRPRHATEHPGNDEGLSIGLVDVDAAELGGDGLLRHRACRQPEARPIENEQKNQHAEQADQEHEQQVATNRIRGNVDENVVEHRRISEGRGIGGMDDHLVDEEQRAYRGHQRRQRVVYGYKTEAYDVDDVADQPRS